MITATKEIQLKPQIIEEIKKSLAAKNRLQFELGKSFLTIQKWLRENSSRLTEFRALTIISQELNHPINELITEAE